MSAAVGTTAHLRDAECGPVGVSDLGVRRAARSAVRHGRVSRVSRDDRRRCAPARVHDGRCAPECASKRRRDSIESIATGEWDVLVVGAGPAGIAAAVCARQAGARTILIDDGQWPGWPDLAPGRARSARQARRAMAASPRHRAARQSCGQRRSSTCGAGPSSGLARAR